MTTPSIESSFNWDFLELLPCTLRLRLRPTLRWSGSVAVTFASFADELRCIDFRGPTEYGILGFSGAAFGFSSMFLLHPVFSGSSAHAPAANNVRRKPRNTVRGGRVYPDVLITARKGLLDENSFYFAQNGRGIPFNGIGICGPTGSGTFGRCARNDGAGVISLTSAQSIQSSNN